MGEYDLHSFILACDFKVDDVDVMWKWLEKHRDGLASIGAHHVVLYESIWEPRRVLATIGIHHARSIREVLRSPAIFEWFNISGADDIPPVFGGEVVEKIDLLGDGSEGHVGRVVVGVMSSVDDVPTLMDKVHDGLDRFRRGGVRKIWVYRALDDGHEVLILQEIADEASARQWIEHPDAAAEWMANAGMGPYPTRFVGRFAHLMSVGGQG
ncbi:fatty-acid--CoA ligase [Mycolicibacterium parafortuitum]|uniref:Fatty-acid--CoA ligase n=1 Tax=Mycolicibacterium parafortuitum TaxID=39692 RepID=A0A7I7U7K3_MYCPF|nr:fatty-acid--CoA ligase [Mycolicibacterium parafortuitum]PQE02437.1 fatty-acid--CoA ligase [Mycobacterium sp. EPG1]BBY77200.1 fatty-acid--CoA ligase [Mycolicibacterium parafortuitum]